jgi:hypothetical protein
MIRTSSLSEACHELFACYPLAARTANHGTIRTMLLMLRDSSSARVFVLSYDPRQDRSPYSLRPRRTTDTVHIEADDSATVPDLVAKAVTRGVPIPRDGSLFGWRSGDALTALVPVYTTSTPESLDPFWAVMPRAGIPKAQWPPFSDERPFGHWFWEYYQAGKLIFVGDLIAGAPDTVFWVNTKAILGTACCAVARDLESCGGYTLRRGIYVHHQALRTGQPLPSLQELLAATGKTDLTPRFRRFGQTETEIAPKTVAKPASTGW